jgi:flavin-dependent dehydrogenase
VTQHASPTGQPRARPAADDADVIVVGAGPGGSSAAYHLARAGLDVLVLEKSTFPRERSAATG